MGIYHTKPGASFKNKISITKSDTTVYSPRLQAIYVGTLGDLYIVDSNGDAITYKNAQGWFFIEVAKVLQSTTAADMVGHW